MVFADLNGLKRINDCDGHQAGDLLLKNASMALQNAFIGDEIYRAGGDEFLIRIPRKKPWIKRSHGLEVSLPPTEM